MPDPFAWIPAADRLRRLKWASGAAAAVFAVVIALDLPLRTPGSPQGIVSLQLAGSVPAAEAILAHWDERARLFASFGLGFDYLFLACYVFAFGLGCAAVSAALATRAPRFSQAGRALAWGLLAAGVLDVIEDAALLRALIGPVVTPWPELATWCAIPKFTLIGLTVAYLIGGGILDRRLPCAVPTR